jgi:flap endonuclease-1
LAILVGTDFNPGVKGVGPKTALKLIKKHGCLEEVIPNLKTVDCIGDYKGIRDLFLNPKITDDYKLEWNSPNAKGVVDFLCRERDFSEDRVRSAVNKMAVSFKESKSKTTLESWFG